MKLIRPLANLRRVYCAGPLFNAAERREMSEIGAALRAAGFETFVPHADSLEFSHVLPRLIARGCEPSVAGSCVHQAIFALDTYQVVIECGSLVFNMNGRVPDEGGVAEMSMAWTTGKPIVIYKEDVRSVVAGRDNPLVVGQSGFATVNEIDLIADALGAALRDHPLDIDWEFACPPHLAHVLQAGEYFWNQIQALGEDRSPDRIGDSILEYYGSTARNGTKPSHLATASV